MLISDFLFFMMWQLGPIFSKKALLYLLHPPFFAHLIVEICHKKTLDFMQLGLPCGHGNAWKLQT
jgi:hypothetical protein